MRSHKVSVVSRCFSSAALLLAPVSLNVAVHAQDSTGAMALPAAVFTQETTPNPSINNFLFGLSADSEDDIWSVGTFASGALALHFDGTQWVSVPMALPNTADMRGVSVLSPNDVWAVGSVFNSITQHFTSVVQHFDGTKWSVVPTPHFLTGDQLFAVKALADNDVFAVGEHHSDSQKPFPLVEHFDGTKWSVLPTPGLKKGQFVSLGAIAAISHTDIWVTGAGPGSQLPTIMHFDGQHFKNVAFPQADAVLAGLAPIATDDVWVVGRQPNGNAEATLTAHWDGKAWTVVPSPNLTTQNGLSSISAISSTNLWAVGCSACGSDTGVNQVILIQHWDGTQWTINPAPLIGTGDNPGSVLAFAPGSVYVAGFSVGAPVLFGTLILHTDQGN